MDQYKSLPSELHVVLANIRLASRYHDFTIVLQRAVSCYGKLSQCGLVWQRIIHLSCSKEVLALDITELISKYAGFFLGWGGRKGPHSKMDWMKKISFFPCSVQSLRKVFGSALAMHSECYALYTIKHTHSSLLGKIVHRSSPSELFTFSCGRFPSSCRTALYLL